MTRVLASRALAAALAAALAGCSSTGTEGERGTVLAPDLEGMLVLETEIPEWNEAGKLVAHAELRNLGPDTLHVLVQTLFLDSAGRPLEPDAPWENRLIPEYSTIHYEKASLADGAIDYRIQVRKGQSH
jgi:hypothetical protein